MAGPLLLEALTNGQCQTAALRYSPRVPPRPLAQVCFLCQHAGQAAVGGACNGRAVLAWPYGGHLISFASALHGVTG